VILANMNTAGTAVGLNVNNCTINGGGTAFRGIDVSVQGTTAFTTILSGNNITGCTGQGIQVGALGNSSVRAKFDSNRTLGNRPTSDLSVGAGNSATLCLVYQNNTAAEYGFAQNLGTTINVEDFGTFGTRNIGLIGVIGNVADVIAGFCGLP
jgi:hypothetical protein